MSYLLSEEEENRFMKIINHKPIWRDPTYQTNDSISNGLSIQPFTTLTSYHLWIRRNLVILNETDEYVYISGSNLIIENYETKKQKLIPLKTDSIVTSIYRQKSSTNENLLFIGEKINPNEDKKYYSGKVEIINLDCNVLREKIILDFGAYVDYNSYVYDCVCQEEGDLCLIILRDEDNENHSKVFIWNYIVGLLLAIEDFDYNFEGIKCSPYKNPKNQFLLYSYNSVVLIEYDSMKRKIETKHIFYDKSDEFITDAEFIKGNILQGIIISFKNEWFEIYKLGINEETKKKNPLYLRADYICLLKNDWVKINDFTPKYKVKPFYLDNFIHPNHIQLLPNFENDNKLSVGAKNNPIKYIITRGDFIFIFLTCSPIVFILQIIKERNEIPKIKVVSIEKLSQIPSVNYSITIDSKMSKFILINGDSIHKLDSPIIKQRELKKSGEINYNLTEVNLTYFKYKIELINNSPSFVFLSEILENSGVGYRVNKLHLTDTPNYFIINNGENSQDLYIYNQIQKNPDEVFSNQKNFDAGIPNYIHKRTKFYKENVSYELFVHKKLDENPLTLTFSPLGKCFFCAYKDSGYIYAILGQEIKEVFKITMYCRGACFNETGNYLAFATSEFENDFTINIFNISTYEYEFMISKVPCPTKLNFVNDSKCIVAQFNDNSINLIGWKLNWRKRLIEGMPTTKDKVEKEENEKNIILKISDFSGNIIDFAYDPSLDHCLITSADKRERVYKGFKEDKHWEWYSDTIYQTCLIVKKYDSIIFGTNLGSLRTCLWPIQNMNKDSNNIEHPQYNEIFIHSAPITSVVISRDLHLLYSSSEDGSVFVSCITCISNDFPFTINNYLYFNQNNVLPKKMFFDYSDIIYLTDPIYQSKIEDFKKKKNAIQNLIGEFQSNKEKLIQNNANALDKERTNLTEILENKVKAVKEKENEKEKVTKNLKEKRENKIKNIRDELGVMKKEFKVQKEDKQIETTKLINCIKIAKEKFEQKKSEIENMRNRTNTNIANCLENMHQILVEKKNEIDKMIEDKKKKFNYECEKNEDKYETQLREKEKGFKEFLEEFEEKTKETNNEIMKKTKDNKNYDEKINEWENHLKELKANNEELMETYIFNTLKLNQMNQLLTDNENKISGKEKLVKEKRLINDRLEQLRFVLEYQIKNLILEKTPIEEQIKNFESLHSDFYKRFNLLYAELLNIGELIDNNQKCIETYRDELSETKKNLYRLKNLYKTIDISLNSILKDKLDSKKDIIDKIFQVYQNYLYHFDDGKKEAKVISPEMKLQTKNIEKEIYHQKNNVLKELIDKRSERRRIGIEKDEMMKDIRLDNQLLIQECSNIRENLSDIMKNINDIEKKFIELTNNNTFLNQDQNIKVIKGDIKAAKDTALLKDNTKGKIAKGNKPNKLPSIKSSRLPNKVNNDIQNVQILSAEELVKKQKRNAEEMKYQKEEVDKMQKKLKELIGDNSHNNISKISHSDYSDNRFKNISDIHSASKTQRVENTKNPKLLSIKTNKYHEKGKIKK